MLIFTLPPPSWGGFRFRRPFRFAHLAGFIVHLREMGRKGGKRRLETMTAEERSTIAKKAAARSAEVRSAKAKKKTSGKTAAKASE
jgi:hypothetical protein